MFIFHVKEVQGQNGRLLVIGKIFYGTVGCGQYVYMYSRTDGFCRAEVLNFYTSQEQTILILNVNYDKSFTCDDVWLVDSTPDDFVMVVEDVFTITGRGIVITGRIKSGCVQVGNTLTIVRKNNVMRDAVVYYGIERDRKIIDYAEAGDSVGILLKLDKNDVSVGDLVCGEF